MHFLPARSHFALYLLLLLSLCFCSTQSCAQSARHSADSAAQARRQILDSTRAAQKSTLETLRSARQHTIDSMKASRTRITDSLTAVRKYRESRHYRDSVTASRSQKTNLIRDASKAKMDSMKAIRQHTSESLIAMRKSSTDALKATQKKRTDSLASIRKYRESRRYTDSVTVVRRVHLDSLRAVRKVASDALTASRKASLDSMKASRKTFTDSLTASRKVHTDSLKAVRKARADALAKAKGDKVKSDKVKETNKLKNLSLKVELGRKKKQEAWDNTKMLKKKWSAPRKLVQNTFTRYNYYFNANRKMEEALANMQRIGKDNYDRPIPLFPFDPSKDSTRFAADMDSVIQKASLGIQIHDPRGKWEDDLYLLLGQAYFYKGNFEQASNSFRYIVAMRGKMQADEAKKKQNSSRSATARREAPSVVTPENKKMLAFLKHEPANNDALLWLARTYTQSGQLGPAESVLDLLSSDSKFPESLQGELALEKAFYDLTTNNTKEAAKQLALVSNDKSQEWWLRRRAAFLDGQLLQQQGSWAGAAAQFQTVTALNPKIEMDFYARKSRAYSLMQAGSGMDEAIASLRGMINDNKYLPYQEQVYYLLGQLSASAKDVPGAEKYFGQGLASAKTTKKQKATTFAALGDLYYNTGDYQLAKSAYDSASKIASAAPEEPSVKLAVSRSKVLDKIAAPARVIFKQDSLLALAALSDKEQKGVVRKYLRSLNKKENGDNPDDAAGALNAAIQNEDVPVEGSLSWYFTNPQLLQQGNTEFKRKWGTRPLADNWRRATAININTPTSPDNAGNNNPLTAGNAAGADRAGSGNGKLGDITESSLLAAIPNSNAQKEIAAGAIQRAYVDLATAYLRQLEDYKHATSVLDTLDARYAAHPYKAEALYVRYLIALKTNNIAAAQGFSNMLQQSYAGTQWAALVRPAAEDGATGSDAGSATASVSDFYDETYGMMMQREWPEVLSRARTGRQRYPDEMYGNRFRIMEAIALAGQGHYSFADSLLSEFLRVHPTDSLHGWAEGALAYIQRQKSADTLHKVVPIPAAPAASISVLPKSSDSVAALPVPANYSYDPQAPHYFIFLFQHLESKALGVRAGTDDFNRLRYSGTPLISAIVPVVPGAEGMVVTKSFKNAALAKAYLQKWKAESVLTREYKATEYKTFIISDANYQKLLADKSTAPYLSFYPRHY